MIKKEEKFPAAKRNTDTKNALEGDSEKETKTEDQKV